MTHGGRVDRLGVVVDHPGQAKVGHFAYEVAVDQDVARGQISMDVAHVGEVAHPRRDAPQHPHQLDDRELAVVFLEEDVERLTIFLPRYIDHHPGEVWWKSAKN